jgi:xanthine dehydrogenase YagS FAD-binding subunit
VKGFDLLRPTTVHEAVSALATSGLAGRPLAGGTDLLAGVMRDHIVGSAMPYPSALVDVASLPELGGIAEVDGGVRIGASVSLVELAESGVVRDRFPMLALAASQVASPEIRAVGTVGGNLAQRPRCWFFRNRDFDCIKKGGTICFAVKGDNRYNAILDGNICFIVHPSDLGSVLLALGASARIVSLRGERIVPFDSFFVSPTVNLVAENVLEPDELIVDVFVPSPAAGTVQHWQKLNEKGGKTWDFALCSVAAAALITDGVWLDGRIVLGGVAPVPYRARVVEEALLGREIVDALPDALDALRAVARPMRDNGFKLDLTLVVLEESLRAMSGAA